MHSVRQKQCKRTPLVDKLTKRWQNLWRSQAPGLAFDRFKELAMQGIFDRPNHKAYDTAPMNIGYSSNPMPESDLEAQDVNWSVSLNRRMI